LKLLGAAVLGTSVTLLAPQVRAQPVTELIEGVITEAALSGNPRTLRLRTAGGEILAEIGDRTLVVFERSAARVPAPADASSLTPGMTVRLVRDAQGVARIHVTSVPERLGTESKASPSLPRAARLVKARLRDLRYDARRGRGEVKADVAGRRESYSTSDAALFRGFRRGDLVLLGVAADGSLLSIAWPRLQGRVMRVDPRRREVTVELEGKQEEFAIANESLLDRVRAGDVIHFDVEEKAGGRRVITAVY
jgi:hypothetical protein